MVELTFNNGLRIKTLQRVDRSLICFENIIAGIMSTCRRL